jgi:hypothetical protein
MQIAWINQSEKAFHRHNQAAVWIGICAVMDLCAMEKAHMRLINLLISLIVLLSAIGLGVCALCNLLSAWNCMKQGDYSAAGPYILWAALWNVAGHLIVHAHSKWVK